MKRPRLFVETCAGLGAVSLRLQGGEYARPPVSRCGNKAGYASVVLRVLGLRPGLGADSYLWIEPDRSVASLLACYPDPERLRAVADVIRGWVGEDARALWERLRGEAAPAEPDRYTAAMLLVQGWTTDGSPCTEDLRSGGGRFCGERVETAGGVHHPLTCSALAGRLSALASLRWPADVRVVHGSALDVEPRGAARWLWLWRRSYNGKGPDGGFNDADGPAPSRYAADAPAPALDTLSTLPWPPTAVLHGSALDCEPTGDLEGCVVYMDPPYKADGARAVTGYGHDLSRADVVALARRWGDAGATVAISEAVPVEVPGFDWHVDIAGERRGQARTFARVKSEWLTLNRPPAWCPAVQRSLFAAAGAA